MNYTEFINHLQSIPNIRCNKQVHDKWFVMNFIFCQQKLLTKVLLVIFSFNFKVHTFYIIL